MKWRRNGGDNPSSNGGGGGSISRRLSGVSAWRGIYGGVMAAIGWRMVMASVIKQRNKCNAQ